jgi:hypothetical protein
MIRIELVNTANLKRNSHRKTGSKSSPKVNPNDAPEKVHVIPAIAAKEALALEKNREQFELMNRVRKTSPRLMSASWSHSCFSLLFMIGEGSSPFDA